MENQKKNNNIEEFCIDINKPDGLLYWSDKFDVTKVKLKAALNAVGTSVKDVETYLKKK